MPKKKAGPKWRSGCPLNASVEILGDRWSLLIIRDMMLRGFRTYKEFLESYEGIATNILADRLRKLIAHGIITTERKQQFMNAVRQRWAETTRAAKSNFHGKTEAFAR